MLQGKGNGEHRVGLQADFAAHDTHLWRWKQAYTAAATYQRDSTELIDILYFVIRAVIHSSHPYLSRPSRCPVTASCTLRAHRGSRCGAARRRGPHLCCHFQHSAAARAVLRLAPTSASLSVSRASACGPSPGLHQQRHAVCYLRPSLPQRPKQRHQLPRASFLALKGRPPRLFITRLRQLGVDKV
jgi:hypothetical protein